MADINIGRALSGLGAAFKNEMPAFIQQVRQEDALALKKSEFDRSRLLQDEDLAERRKKTMFQDAVAANILLSEGDYRGIADLMEDRVRILGPTGADTSHSRGQGALALRAAAGDTRAMAELERLITNQVRVAYGTGMVPRPVSKNTTIASGSVLLGPDNQELFSNKVAPETFEEITLPDGRPGQRNTVTGKRSAIGGGGTTINMPQQGTIPPGYTAIYDNDGRIVRLEPIEGGPVAQDILEQEQAAVEDVDRALIASESSAQSSDIVLQDVGRLRNLVTKQGMFTPVTGALGVAASNLPGQPAADYMRIQETIKANAAFSALGEMRAASKTGGALGSITEGELDLLASTIGTLDQGLSSEELLYNLDRIEQIYTGIMKKLALEPEIAKQYGIQVDQSFMSDPLGLY